jgi:alkylated DNA repair dioxygenase AlkB
MAAQKTVRKIHHDNFNVHFYPDFLSAKIAKSLYQYLAALIEPKKRRHNILIGNPGLIYSVTYHGKTSHTEVIPWSDIPGMTELKDLIDSITGMNSTVCIVQVYPDGNVGIGSHRDKEMVPGTHIAGISLGAERKIIFERRFYDPIEILLPSGSMYVMFDPTNSEWRHKIPLAPEVTEQRISLTFRNY